LVLNHDAPSNAFIGTVENTTSNDLNRVRIVVLAVRLSKRITAPVTALKEATQAIAQGESATLPVTSSDELGTMSKAFNRMTAALETQRELRRG